MLFVAYRDLVHHLEELAATKCGNSLSRLCLMLLSDCLLMDPFQRFHFKTRRQELNSVEGGMALICPRLPVVKPLRSTVLTEALVQETVPT